MTELSLLGLRVVREVARHGSFSEAADRLGYTQSAVSRQIAAAERSVGRPLFERHARGVRPTEAGHLLARRADAVLGEVAAAYDELAGLEGARTARLRAGAYSSALAALVPRALAGLRDRMPAVVVKLSEGLSAHLLARVARGRLDAAVVVEPAEHPTGVEVTAIYADPLLLAVPRGHRLAGRASVKPDELEHERWVAGAAAPQSSLLGAWTGSSWDPEIAFVVREWTAKLGLVAAGHGVTTIPGLAAPALPHAVALVRIDDPAAVRRTALAVPVGAPPGREVEAFAEALRDAAAGLGAEVRRALADSR